MALTKVPKEYFVKSRRQWVGPLLDLSVPSDTAVHSLFLRTVLLRLPWRVKFWGQGTLDFLFYFTFLAALWHMEFPSLGSEPRHNCSLCHGCRILRSLTHCAKLGAELSLHSRDTADTLAPQWELQHAVSELAIKH